MLKMRSVYVLCLMAIVVSGKETYTTENDELDIEAVVKDLPTLQAFTGCFLDTSACDAVPGAFKQDIADAVQTACAKCTPAQKHIFKVFLSGLKVKLPLEYAAFQKKYDPEGKHFADLEAAVVNA